MKKITYLFIALLTLAFSFSAKAQCDYTLEMNDSWGDGWNGFTVDILIDIGTDPGDIAGDDIIAVTTIGMSMQEFLTIPGVNDGSIIDIVQTAAGSFPLEVSFRLLDPLGAQQGVLGNSTTDITNEVVACPACDIPQATYAVNTSNCPGSADFSIDVTVTDIGAATSVTISDDQATTPVVVLNASVPTTINFGSYTAGIPVIITVTNDDNAICTVGSSALTNSTCPPSNDDCANATVITPGGVLAFDTTSATQDNAMDCGTDLATAPNVWFSFTAIADDTITFSTCNDADYDTKIHVYSGTCGALVCEGSNDDGGTCGLTSEIDIVVSNTVTYLIAVSGWNLNTGTGNLTAGSALLGTNDLEVNGFEYFPNPVNDNLSLRSLSNIQNVAVYNMLGQEVMKMTPNAVSSEVDMNSLSQGSYFVRVTINNSTETIRIIKK